jgi:plastocyanin
MHFTAPATPGSFAFHCKHHANMHGVLTVQSDATPLVIP